MTFDDWMLGISECHKPGDDGVTLRMLRACWAEAQAVERGRCAALLDAEHERCKHRNNYAKVHALMIREGGAEKMEMRPALPAPPP